MSTIELIATPTIAEIVKDLLVIIRRHANARGEGWNGATTIEQAGIDSLELVEVIFDIEDKYKTKVEFKASEYMLTTIEDVARLVQMSMRRSIAVR